MDKSYAYISINGKGHTSEVATALGVKPTLEWNVGDARKEGSKYGFSQLPDGFDAFISCVGWHEQQGLGFHISRDLIVRLGKIGLAVDFDLYCHAQ